MTRLLAFAAAALALLAWLRRRDRPDPYWGLAEQQLEEDDVQPPDPVTTYPAREWWTARMTYPVVTAPDTYHTGDFWPQPWVNTSDSLEPLTAADRSYIEATTLAAIRRSAQSSDAPTGGM